MGRDCSACAPGRKSDDDTANDEEDEEDEEDEDDELEMKKSGPTDASTVARRSQCLFAVGNILVVEVLLCVAPALLAFAMVEGRAPNK